MTMSSLKAPLLVALLLAAFLYSEQVVKPPPRPGRVVVTYWEKWTGFEGEAMRAIVDDFNKSQDKIWVEYLSVSAVNTKTMLASAAGVPPDVAGVWDGDVVPFADARASIPLDDYCREFGIEAKDYIPSYWNICTYDGHVYALPTTPASTALHYNVDLFEKAGLDPNKPPRTTEELSEMSDQITKQRTDKSIIVAGFHPSEPGWWNWWWCHLFGGKLWDGDKLTANDPHNIKAFEWIQSFSKKYGPQQLHAFRTGFGNFSSPQNPFIDNKVAMEIQGVWMANYISQYNPKLRWKAAPFPYPKDHPEMANSTMVGLDVLVIPAGAKHPREAMEFIRYTQTQPAMEKLCLLQKKHSPLAKVSEKFFSEHPNPYIKMFTDLPWGKNSFCMPKIGIWFEYSNELNAAFEAVYLMHKTPKEALDYVQARMQPKWEHYKQILKLREKAN